MKWLNENAYKYVVAVPDTNLKGLYDKLILAFMKAMEE